jgi:type I restriction enzyme S subunit
MAGEWKVQSLRDAGVSLIDCEHRTPPANGSGYPYVAIPQIKRGRIDLSDARRISHEHFIEWNRKARPQPYDVILSRRCNPGETAFIPAGMECALGQNLVLLRADDSKVFPPFLRWLVRGEDWWEQIGKFLNVGAIFDSLKCADIPNFQLPFPSLPEQKAIAHILGTLDDKIELNRKMNETLEAMAQAVFKSWFVDFDPVHAKAKGKKPDGMDSETADLFPDSFVNSELGKIPKGWKVDSLTSIMEINPPYRISKGSSSPYVDMKSAPTASARVSDVVMRTFTSGSRFMDGDTLVARITPCLENGKTAYVDFLAKDEVGWGSTEFIVLHSKQPFPSEFSYFLARTEEFRSFAISNMSGTSGRQRVPTDCLTHFRLPIPEPGILSVFGGIAKDAMIAMRKNDEQTASLSATRDTILPKLLSGKIRIKDAEKFVEAAA